MQKIKYNDDIIASGVYLNKSLDRWELWEVDEETNEKIMLGFCDGKLGMSGLQILEYEYRDWYATEEGRNTRVEDFGVTIH